MLERLRELFVKASSAKNGTLYVHFPCFDGVVSGVLAIHFLEQSKHWHIDEIYPVNYDRRDTWLRSALPKHSAIVDFLYHPHAEFWADHHLTSFVNPASRLDFDRKQSRTPLFYDSHCGSTASLLWTRLGKSIRNADHLTEMVHWAEKIDSAAYSSVDEAVLGDDPALRINFSLMGAMPTLSTTAHS